MRWTIYVVAVVAAVSLGYQYEGGTDDDGINQGDVPLWSFATTGLEGLHPLIGGLERSRDVEETAPAPDIPADVFGQDGLLGLHELQRGLDGLVSGVVSHAIPEDDEGLAAAAVLGSPRPGALSDAEMRDVLTTTGWPLELHDQALRVAWCESSYRPDAVGDAGASHGLFQIQPRWHRGKLPSAGYPEDADLHDPIVNAALALVIYQGSGWGPWSCRP